MVIAEENPPTPAHSNSDIDLKCAEKVTDSDNEELSGAGEEHKSARDDDENASSRDFTCKPKAIKAQRQTMDSALLSYQQAPKFNSPKNPTGISPFHPTGSSGSLPQPTRSNASERFAGGAFKTMPISPKETKPLNNENVPMETDAPKMPFKADASQLSVFNFNLPPSCKRSSRTNLSPGPNVTANSLHPTHSSAANDSLEMSQPNNGSVVQLSKGNSHFAEEGNHPKSEPLQSRHCN